MTVFKISFLTTLMNKRLALGPRDYEILTSVFRNKVMSLHQINKFFFSGASISASSHRLSKLCRYNLLERGAYFDLGKSHRVYSLSEKGLSIIASELPCRVDSKKYKSDSLVHDLNLVDLTFIFQKMSVVRKIFTESELQSCSEYQKDMDLLPFIDIRSDRVCLLSSNEDKNFVALEYERSLKSEGRNELKIEEYYLNSSIPAVFYVCENDKILKSLLKTDVKVSKNNESKMYFCLKKDVLENSRMVKFKRHDGATLKFR